MQGFIVCFISGGLAADPSPGLGRGKTGTPSVSVTPTRILADSDQPSATEGLLSRASGRAEGRLRPQQPRMQTTSLLCDDMAALSWMPVCHDCERPGKKRNATGAPCHLGGPIAWKVEELCRLAGRSGIRRKVCIRQRAECGFGPSVEAEMQPSSAFSIPHHCFHFSCSHLQNRKTSDIQSNTCVSQKGAADRGKSESLLPIEAAQLCLRDNVGRFAGCSIVCKLPMTLIRPVRRHVRARARQFVL